jgi:hypothetical protein
MVEQLSYMAAETRPGRRMARRIFASEAYRQIAAGNAPETLSQFATWFTDSSSRNERHTRFAAADACRQRHSFE